MRGRIGWRLAAVAAATVLGVGAAAAPAQAKGADQVSITGPGLQKPIVVGGDGEPGNSSDLSQLAEGSGLFQAMFGADAAGALSADKPSGRLGPRYSLVYRVPAETTLRVHQDLYPLAEGGPVTYTQAGQAAFGSGRTFGGWFATPTTFKALLAKVGVPMAATPAEATSAPDPDRTNAPAAVPAASRSGGRGWALPVTLAALVVATAGTVALMLRRRHGGQRPGGATA